jgi:hypothetical protein
VLRTPHGRLYALVNVPERFAAGDSVELQGTVVETSICMQGTATIHVERVRRR